MLFDLLHKIGVTEKEVICYLLWKNEGHTTREIATMLGVSHAAVANWVNRVKKMVDNYAENNENLA